MVDLSTYSINNFFECASLCRALGDSKVSKICHWPELLSESELVPEILPPFPGIGLGLEYDETLHNETQGEVSLLWETVENVFFFLKIRIYFSLSLNGRQMLISHF